MNRDRLRCWERWLLNDMVCHFTGRFESGENMKEKIPTKEEMFVKEFDDLEPADLMQMDSHALNVANYLKIKLLNSCVQTNKEDIKGLKAFDSKLRWGLIISVLLLLVSLGVAFIFKTVIGG